MFFFKKSRSSRKRNRKNKESSNSYKKGGITREQLYAISETIIKKKRLIVYAENC